MMSKPFLLGFAAALLALSAGCGSPACGPKNCAGCCDPQGSCQLPTEAHCGLAGVACVACTGVQQCENGSCEQPGAVTGGTAAGASSGASGSSGSSTGSSGATGSASTNSGSSGSSGSSSTTATASSSSGTSGGSCCLTLGCSAGCDPVNCVCLSGTTTGGSSGSFDAGAICQTQSCVVYAETQHTLYQVDPNPPNALTQLCNFTGAIPGDAGVNDIAVQRNGTLYGITKTDLYLINPQTCSGTHVTGLVQSAGGFNCLTFTDQDTLVAADASGQVVTIDTSTGAVSDAGHFGNNMGCSGDIVALQTGDIFATAKLLNGTSSDTDVLVTLNPANGYAATAVSSNQTGYKGIFGLGYWAGTFYGFDRNGNVLAIDPVAGTATLLHNEPNTSFYGAGTTPLAPVIVRQ